MPEVGTSDHKPVVAEHSITLAPSWLSQAAMVTGGPCARRPRGNSGSVYSQARVVPRAAWVPEEPPFTTAHFSDQPARRLPALALVGPDPCLRPWRAHYGRAPREPQRSKRVRPGDHTSRIHLVRLHRISSWNNRSARASLMAHCRRQSDKDAKLALKLGQLQPFIAVLPHECMANSHLLG